MTGVVVISTYNEQLQNEHAYKIYSISDRESSVEFKKKMIANNVFLFQMSVNNRTCIFKYIYIYI